jgi:hypothetical protein
MSEKPKTTRLLVDHKGEWYEPVDKPKPSADTTPGELVKRLAKRTTGKLDKKLDRSPEFY